MDDKQTFEGYREAWLEEVRAGNPSTTELGRRFAWKLLTQWLGIDPEDAAVDIDLVYCDGAGDGGIDLAYLKRSEDPETEGDTWYLVQSKYGSAFQGTNTILAESQKIIETLDGKRPNLSSLAHGLLERLTNFRNTASELDGIVLVFATEEPLTDAQKRALEDVRAMAQSRLGTLMGVDSVSIATIYERAPDKPPTTHLRVPLEVGVAPAGGGLVVTPVPLLGIYRFMKAFHEQTGDLQRLYEENVRLFMGLKHNKVNRGIHNTLVSEPERFGLYNNGITIVVADINSTAGGELELVDPYIVNGAQTTSTIWEVFYRRYESGGTGTDPEMEAWKERVARGVVITKIVKVALEDKELLQKITKFANTQTAVGEKDFISLDQKFRAWAHQMEERYGVFLEIQRGGWDARRAQQKQSPGMRQLHDYANALELIKVYGAGWLGEAGRAFKGYRDFLPTGMVFERIMNDPTGDINFGADDLYAAYRLKQAGEEYGFGRGAVQTRTQSRFLFYMVVHELLRHIMIGANLKFKEQDRTRALLTLFDDANEHARKLLFDRAVSLVDQYLTNEADHSVAREPSYQQFGSDRNRYLKWDQLGKSEDASPHFRFLIEVNRSVLNMSLDGKPSPSEQIAQAIRA